MKSLFAPHTLYLLAYEKGFELFSREEVFGRFTGSLNIILPHSTNRDAIPAPLLEQLKLWLLERHNIFVNIEKVDGLYKGRIEHKEGFNETRYYIEYSEAFCKAIEVGLKIIPTDFHLHDRNDSISNDFYSLKEAWYFIKHKINNPRHWTIKQSTGNKIIRSVSALYLIENYKTPESVPTYIPNTLTSNK